MITEVIKVDPSNPDPAVIKKAADYIRRGQLVAIPTETVYGLAGDLANKEAVDRLYKVKARPGNKPFTVCISRKEKLEELTQEALPYVYRLIDKFWPGPLTLVLKARYALACDILALVIDKSQGSPTIGLRMPSNKVALNIINSAAGSIVLPSANLTGQKPPRSADEVLAGLGGVIDLVVDAGQTELGIESTVIDATKFPFKILREGAVEKESLERIANRKRVLFVCTGNSCRSVMAEGLLGKALENKKRTDVEVLSAGIISLGGLVPSAETLGLLAQEGIDMSAHRSTRINEGLLRSSDLILVMEDTHEARILELTPEVKNRLYLLKEFAKISSDNLNVEDPIGQGGYFYQKVFYSIKECVERIVNIL